MQLQIGKQVFTVRSCKTTLEQGRGLLFTSPKKIQGAFFFLPFPKRVALHSLFLVHTLTLVYIDADSRVLSTGRLSPFTLFYLTPRTTHLIELFGNHSFKKREKIIMR